MSYAPTAPGGNSVYIPTDAATDGMTVGYSRNYKSFRINQYAYLKPVNKRKGFYRVVNPAPGMRLGSNPANDAVWTPGADRPNGLKNQAESGFTPYQTTRYDEAVLTDKLAIQQANWSVEDEDARNIGQLAMTRRTWLAHQALSGASWGGNTANVDSGQASPICATGNWSNGTPANPNILISLNYAAMAIVKQTGGVVQPKDLALVVNPNAAAIMAQSPEIQQAFIQSIDARALMTGGDAEIADYNARYGLPLNLRGYPIIVEDAVQDSGAIPESAYSPGFIMGSNIAYLLARPNQAKNAVTVGKTDIQEANSEVYFPINWSLCCFAFEEFTVEAFDEVKHRRVDAHVTYDLQYQVVSTYGAFLFTHCFS